MHKNFPICGFVMWMKGKKKGQWEDVARDTGEI